MNIVIISGSHRPNSNSVKLANKINENVLAQLSTVDSHIIELAKFPALLSHYGDEQFQSNELQQQKAHVLDLLYGADGIIIIAPEWGGSLPPALVNLLLLCANGSAGGLPLGHKPAFAVGVSDSGAGASPVSQLKAYSAKNTHLTWCPQHAIVQNVSEFLTAPWPSPNNDRTGQLQSRFQTGIESLLLYAEQLKPIRDQLVTLSKVHPFGQ